VRWVDTIEEFRDKDGNVEQSMATVYVPELPGGGEVAPGGWLWLGVRADLVDEAVPHLNPGAFPVKRVDKAPTFKANKFIRKAYL